MRNFTSMSAIVVSLFFLSGCTTLHIAASNGNIKAIDRLVAEGNDLNERDNEGMTPLIRAINMNQKESVIVLLKSGADINTPDSIFLNSPLHHAVIQGNSSLVKLLLEKKADSSLRNNEGKSPLDLAVEMGNNAMAQLLKVKSVEKKVDTPNNKSSDLNVILSEQKISSSSLSEGEMREKLKKMISGHETKAIRTFLNENIHAIDLIEESQRLRYIGPANWRVIDIVDKIKQDKLPEEKIIDHIAVAQLPYKKFTQEEISLLLRYGLSYKIINAMINVSE
jgi:hypothetical protein